MNNQTGFAAVPMQPKKKEGDLDPRATRYGVLPIWSLPTSARDFYVWELPANSVFPFREFVGEIGQNYKGEITYTNERLPGHQVTDLLSTNQFFVELTALAKLMDEDKARKVAEVLTNPRSCGKYGIELGNTCTTCWANYLHGEVQDRIKEAFVGNNELMRVANKSVEELKGAIVKALDEARRQVDIAVRDIDDPRSGKTQFSPTDFVNVYHTHSERPQYKTTTNTNEATKQIADALSILASQAKPSQDTSNLSEMVANLMKETAELKARLAEKEEAPQKKV
jgi:hypothetical protein